MRSPVKNLLSLALLLGALPVHADNAPKGDYWVVHHQASLGKSKAYLVDGDPGNIYERPGGVKSVGVYLFDQQPGKPDFTVYDVEVDCKNKRARVTGALDFSSVANTLRKAKFSNQWQGDQQPWLAQSRDFICKPAERQALKMEHLGVMSASELSRSGPQLFEILTREALRAEIIRQIDDAFTQMPAK